MKNHRAKTLATVASRPALWLAAVVGVLALGPDAHAGNHQRVTPQLICSKGTADQRLDVGVTMPAHVEAGATYDVRIDGVSSGKVSHFGLNYLHGITVEYVLPPGGAYVEGSARFVPGTGTANVLPGASLSHHAGILTMSLPGKVDEGTLYTPPSLTVQLRAIGSPGTRAVVAFKQLRLRANAVIVGDVAVSCDPAVSPYPLGATLITPAQQASAR